MKFFLSRCFPQELPGKKSWIKDPCVMVQDKALTNTHFKCKNVAKIIIVVLVINRTVACRNGRIFTKNPWNFTSSVSVHLSEDIPPRFTKVNDITAIWSFLGIPRVLTYFNWLQLDSRTAKLFPT